MGAVDTEPKQQKEDISKDLIAVWELTSRGGEPAPKGPIFLELAKDGKMRCVVIAADAIGIGEGIYETNGRKLNAKMKWRGEKEIEWTSEIKKLTETDLRLADQVGKEEVYKRHE
jgi:uncharacterized protein (TIGR03066 family)